MIDDTMSQAILATYARYGIQIDKVDNTDAGIIMLFSVPKNSYHKGKDDVEMAGKHLAKRIKHTLEEMGVVFADCRFKTRDEFWSKDKADYAEKMAYKDMGYKDWQIK